MKEVCGAASPDGELVVVKHQVDGTQLLILFIHIYVYLLSYFHQFIFFLVSLLQCMQHTFCTSFLVYSIEIKIFYLLLLWFE